MKVGGGKVCARCGEPAAGSGGRLAHLRRAHPEAFRRLLVRLAAPWAYLGGVVVALALHAPRAVLVVLMAGSLIGAFALRQADLRERGAAAPTVGGFLRRGGAGLLALLVLAVLLRLGR